MRSWTHETGAVRALDGAPAGRSRFFRQFEPRFDTPSGGFPEMLLERSYPSDGHGGHHFLPLLAGFDELLEHHPDVLAEDRDRAFAINRAAHEDPPRRIQALQVQYEDQSLTVHPGLGRELGGIYLEAMLDGALPRTYQLISKYRPHGRVAHEGASCNPAKARWAERSIRPYLHSPDLVDRFDVEGGDAHAGRDGSFPSGHTSEAFWQGVTLATLLPELAPGILARTADSGHSRVLLGAHYPLDVIGGRMMGTFIAAGRWHDEQFRPLLHEAREEIVTVLETRAGRSLAEAIAADEPYMPLSRAREHYRDLLGYGFSPISRSGRMLEVPAEAPDLLLTSHPDLSYAQRAQLLAETALVSGGPLDIAGPYGGWQRIDLLAAMTARW